MNINTIKKIGNIIKEYHENKIYIHSITQANNNNKLHNKAK